MKLQYVLNVMIACVFVSVHVALAGQQDKTSEKNVEPSCTVSWKIPENWPKDISATGTIRNKKGGLILDTMIYSDGTAWIRDRYAKASEKTGSALQDAADTIRNVMDSESAQLIDFGSFEINKNTNAKYVTLFVTSLDNTQMYQHHVYIPTSKKSWRCLILAAPRGRYGDYRKTFSQVKKSITVKARTPASKTNKQQSTNTTPNKPDAPDKK